MATKTAANEGNLNILGKDDDRKGAPHRAKEAGQSTAESKGSAQGSAGAKTGDSKAAAVS